MRTKNFDQFIQTFGKTMSWPFVESAWMWVLLWIPFVLFVLLSLKQKEKWTKAEAWTVALGGWVLMNALGVGIFRGAFSTGPISRYMDITAIAMVANGLALFLLPGKLNASGQLAKWFPHYKVAWCVVMLGGVFWITNYELVSPASMRVEHQQLSIKNVRQFMQTDDLQFMLSKKQYEIPHPDPTRLATWLRSEKLREILPVSIRDPLQLEQDSAIGFSSPGLYPQYVFDLNEPTWGSYGREGDRTVGSFISKPLPAPKYSYLVTPAINRLSCRQDTVTMHWVDVATRKSYRACQAKDAIGGWKEVYARVPKVPLLLEAKDNDSTFWVGFQSPRELSALSYWSFRFIAMGPWVLALGVALIFLGRREEPADAA